MTADLKTLVFSLLELLGSLKSEHPEGSRDALDTAISGLGEAFGLDAQDPAQARQFSLKPHHPLPEVFEAGCKTLGAKSVSQQVAEAEATDGFSQFVKVVSSKGYFKGVEEGSEEHVERMSKLVAKFKARTEASGGGGGGQKGDAGGPARASAPPAEAPASSAGGDTAKESPKAAKEREAEEVKARGNKLLVAKDYEGAEKCYTEALELSPSGPNSHVYLCNRAAALCYLGRNDDAVVDCQESIELNPSYAKAYTRLGYAYFQLADYDASVKAYKKSLELDPGNAANLKSLKKAMSKLGTDAGTGEASAEQGSRAMPDLSALASMMGGAGAGGADGGGLASMMAAMSGAGAGGNNQGAGSGSDSDGGLSSLMGALSGGAGGASGAGTGGAGNGGEAAGGGDQGGLASMLSALAGGAGEGGGTGGGSGGGQGAGLAGMLNNPAMMQQVQSMMSNPAMMQQVQSIMSNPAMMQSIMGMMGARGAGAPGSKGASDGNGSSTQ